MKLILYRYNLKRYCNPLRPYNEAVTICHFPDNIQEAARYAAIVEYQDGNFTKILKDRYNESVPDYYVVNVPHGVKELKIYIK